MKINEEFAGEIISRTLTAGADHAEVFIRSSRSLGIEVKKQEVDSLKSSRVLGYGLRVIRGNRPGFSYSSDPTEVGSVIRNAVDAALYSDPDAFHSLPGSAGCSDVDVYDPLIDSIGEKEAIGLAMDIERSALESDVRISKVRKAQASFSSSEITIFNSNAVKASYRSTSCSASITVIAEDNGDAQTGFDYSGSRFMRNVCFGRVGANAANGALRLLGAKRISARRCPVILDNTVAVEFLGILAGSLSADSVQKNRSLLAGRTDEKVISPKISVIDSGLVSGLIGSSPVDDEGVPSQSKTLIERGVLRTFLHNTYTANKWSVSSTGNASRGGHASSPSVGITNLFIESAQDAPPVAAGSLCGLAGTGLYVLDAMGVHTANPVTGDFSIGVSGIWVENGNECHPVKEAVMSGNILELFEKIEAVGDDIRFFGNIGSPSLLVSGMDISA